MASIKIVFLVLMFSSVVLSTADENDIASTIQLEIGTSTSTNEIPSPWLIESLRDKHLTPDEVCKSCHIVVNNLLIYRWGGANKVSMRKYLRKLCIIFLDWGQAGCEGMTDIVLDSVLFMIDNKKHLTSERICAIYLQKYKCVDPDAIKWEIPLPPLPPKTTKYGPEVYTDTSTINILQLTDFHYDPLYLNGSNAVCAEALCCQSGIPAKPENAAGFWGDYNVCDMPRRTIDNLLENVKEKHLENLDFVYFTGDIVSHKSWATTRESNANMFKTLFELFDEAFQGKPVYPILGNHEPHPTDFYSPESVTQDHLSTQWVLDMAAEEWARWLPEYTKTTIVKGGYYTVLVRPGFRIIALNSNFCFTSNLWLFYEDEDSHQQLAWLVEELYKAEKNKEKVHILSHIPPGEILCHRQWSNQFRKIVNRFADTISAQFNGHTHVDEFRVFYNPENASQVINVAFNGGGFTTFVGFNSNYKIYKVNAQTALVENYDQYIFNLTKANENFTPDWYKLYSFKDAYGMSDMSFRSFGILMDRMASDDDLLYQYYRFLVKSSDVKMKEGCDENCLKQLLCYITAVETDLSVNC